MKNTDGRRELKTRDVALAQNIARWLSQKNVTPNQISILSLVFAGFAALSLLALPHARDWSIWLLPVMAALFIQCRLLCNLFDGMVAVEGGKGTPAGELFNDIPDRIADLLILIAAGYAITICPWSEALSWCAGLFAVMTAYLRTLAASIGAPIDFRGPMAKQHRMAVMTGACLLTAVEPLFWPQGYVLLTALTLIIIGCLVTLWRRGKAAYVYLEEKGSV